jgi:hypothetical protein
VDGRVYRRQCGQAGSNSDFSGCLNAGGHGRDNRGVRRNAGLRHGNDDCYNEIQVPAATPPGGIAGDSDSNPS